MSDQKLSQKKEKYKERGCWYQREKQTEGSYIIPAAENQLCH